MGFSDRDIVALSGGHTLGRCHKVRSGYDGPWTDGILAFNNDYFKNLMQLEWEPRRCGRVEVLEGAGATARGKHPLLEKEE